MFKSCIQSKQIKFTGQAREECQQYWAQSQKMHNFCVPKNAKTQPVQVEM